MRSIETFLEGNARSCGFGYGVQSTTEAAWRLEREGEHSAASRLTGQEYALFRELQPPRRQAEWLAGRLAAKQALEMAMRSYEGEMRSRSPAAFSGASTAGEASILNYHNGAPYIDGFPGLRISLSHSHALAVAVVSASNIGVDIEKIEFRPSALVDHFFCAEENQWLEAHSRSQEERDKWITWVWTRKEGLSKALRLGGRLEFKQVNVLPDETKVYGGSRDIRLVSGICEGYCISLALSKRD